jgi:capsular polysaccharide transport system permease protein
MNDRLLSTARAPRRAADDLVHRLFIDRRSATELAGSAKVQSRVIGALVRREILTRFGRHNFGFMWLFLEPMMFTLGIITLWTLTRASHGSNLPIAPFAITGYSSVLLWRNAANRCGNAVEPNRGLLYHRNVRVIDLFVARLILEIVGATTSLFVIASGFIFFGYMDPPRDLLTMAFGWTLLAWFACGLGFVVGSISELSEFFDRIWHTITYLVFPLSGAAFLVEWLPTSAQDVVTWVPMVNGTEMLRDGYYGPLITAHYSVLYLICVNFVLTLVGISLLRKVARKVEGQ